jgi:hypothetical protein
LATYTHQHYNSGSIFFSNNNILLIFSEIKKSLRFLNSARSSLSGINVTTYITFAEAAAATSADDLQKANACHKIPKNAGGQK